MSYTEEGEQLADKSPCAELRASLKMCLLESDCCKKVIRSSGFVTNFSIVTKCLVYSISYHFQMGPQEKVLPRDCLKRHDNTVPEECHALKYTFFECKRSIVRKLSLFIY